MPASTLHTGSPSLEYTFWEGRSHADLVLKIQEGDPKAMSWVVSTYRPGLLRYARRLLADGSEPEDIVQEAFARFWARRFELRPNGSIRALLYISVRTIARDEYRVWGRRMVLRTDFQSHNSSETPLEEVLAGELYRSFREAYAQLSPRRQEVFRLVRDEGLTHRETARAMGITTRTVKNTMTTALSELRERLEPEGSF